MKPCINQKNYHQAMCKKNQYQNKVFELLWIIHYFKKKNKDSLDNFLNLFFKNIKNFL